MKHKAIAWLQIIVLLAFLAIVAAVLFPVFIRHDPPSRRSMCQSNLKQIGLGFLQYTQDAGEKFPLVSTEQGWVGALLPYTKSEQLFQCSEEKLRKNENLTDYWFNRRLAGASWEIFDSPAVTLLGGDGESSDDPNVSLQRLPPLWMTKKASPARRHFDTGNYLYADGHVKALKPERISLDKPDGNVATFLAR